MTRLPRDLVVHFEALYHRYALQPAGPLRSPTGAANQCRIVSERLATELPGIVRVVWVRDSTVPFPHKARRVPVTFEHALIALSGGGFVDATRHQFDPHAERPTYYGSIAELARDWKEINHDPDAAADQWRALPV